MWYLAQLPSFISENSRHITNLQVTLWETSRTHVAKLSQLAWQLVLPSQNILQVLLYSFTVFKHQQINNPYWKLPVD